MKIKANIYCNMKTPEPSSGPYSSHLPCLAQKDRIRRHNEPNAAALFRILGNRNGVLVYA